MTRCQKNIGLLNHCRDFFFCEEWRLSGWVKTTPGNCILRVTCPNEYCCQIVVSNTASGGSSLSWLWALLRSLRGFCLCWSCVFWQSCACPEWFIDSLGLVTCTWRGVPFGSFTWFSTPGISSASIKSYPGLEKNPVRSSRTSRFSLRASNFLSFLARWARTQASHSLTKFLITILRRKGKL